MLYYPVGTVEASPEHKSGIALSWRLMSRQCVKLTMRRAIVWLVAPRGTIDCSFALTNHSAALYSRCNHKRYIICQYRCPAPGKLDAVLLCDLQDVSWKPAAVAVKIFSYSSDKKCKTHDGQLEGSRQYTN